MAKRLVDPYGPESKWFKVLNRAYSQKEGRGKLFERRRKEAGADDQGPTNEFRTSPATLRDGPGIGNSPLDEDIHARLSRLLRQPLDLSLAEIHAAGRRVCHLAERVSFMAQTDGMLMQALAVALEVYHRSRDMQWEQEAADRTHPAP